MTSTSIDFIGDIHGKAKKLHALLTKMGYRERMGVWRHPTRTAAFLGDYIDRGEDQLETIRTVRRMCDAGTAEAIAGNHEFNAVAWHLPNPRLPGEFLRPHGGPHGENNRRQHAAFLQAVGGNRRLHDELVDWFLSLPLWLDKPGFRAAHACWNTGAVELIRGWLGEDGRLSRETMVDATLAGSPYMQAVELVTKGPEVELPAGTSFRLRGEDHDRTSVRIRWWDGEATTYRQLALIGKDDTSTIPDTPVPDPGRFTPEELKPTFFGHYWMRGEPRLLSPTLACLDYSVAADGELVAYRWDGEQTLSASNLVSTAAPGAQESQRRRMGVR